jgi:uncharacterized membrane protein
MHRWVKTIALIAIVLCTVAITAGYVYTRQSVIVPHIVPAAGETGQVTATHSFRFEDHMVTITVPVSAAVYDGAKATDKSVSIYGNVSESTWVSASYLAMVNDSVQDTMYDELAGQFRQIRDNEHLTSDEYIELLAAYVQSLTYKTSPDSPAKYPVETVVDGSGDCDDKSLLLAGLLFHEGYNVTLLSFSPEAHMALGIASTDALYRDIGFAYLETTNLSYVGVPPTELTNGVILTSEPLIIPVGDGTMEYTSGGETTYIATMADTSAQKAEALGQQVQAEESALLAQKDRIEQLETQMEVFKNNGNIQAYNAQVGTHNVLVNTYNTGLASYRQQYAKFKAWADLHNYIVTHAYDRKGVYDYIRANLPA